MDIETFKRMQKVNKILKASGYGDSVKKPTKKEINKYLPTYEELLQIPEFAELKSKFDLVPYSDLNIRVNPQNGVTTKYRDVKRTTINFVSNLINKRMVRKAVINVSADDYSSWNSYEERIDKMAIRLSASAPGYVTIYANPNVDTKYYTTSFHGYVVTRDHPFYTREEKLDVFNIIENILYAAAINLGSSAIKSIFEGNVNITSFIKTYGTSINDELSIEACKSVVSLFDDIDMKAFFKALVNIPDNKAMDLITAVLENPKISKKFMDYDAQNPGLLEDPEKIKKLAGKLR